jgi:hypothetical protein
MWTFKTGDLIAKIRPFEPRPLQTGIVIDHDNHTFVIKWTSFDKVFFMEKEGDIFKELNNSFLLSTVRINRKNKGLNLSLLSSNYNNGKEKEKIP